MSSGSLSAAAFSSTADDGHHELAVAVAVAVADVNTISIQDRKEQTLLVLKSELMAKLDKEVKSLDEDSWMFDGPRLYINLISRPALMDFEMSILVTNICSVLTLLQILEEYYNTIIVIFQEMRGRRSIEIWKMGTVSYLEALKLQEKLTSERKLHKITDTLLSLQHPPTYTLGKRRTIHNLLVSEAELKSMGAELHHTERGGDITFHGPHQAILYPIISLRDIGIGARKYVENLESTMIELASLYGVKARAGRAGETGVWVGERKIGAIGVRISSGITSHGLAFNVDPDLNYFKHIVPCGIADKEVTSLQKEVGQVLPCEEEINKQLISCFVRIFGYSDVNWRESSDGKK